MIEDEIISLLNKNRDLFQIPHDFSIDKKTVIYGENGILNSIFLIHLLVDLEEVVNEKRSSSILLVSANTLSKAKGPFFTVRSLANFVESLL